MLEKQKEEGKTKLQTGGAQLSCKSTICHDLQNPVWPGPAALSNYIPKSLPPLSPHSSQRSPPVFLKHRSTLSFGPCTKCSPPWSMLPPDAMGSAPPLHSGPCSENLPYHPVLMSTSLTVSSCPLTCRDGLHTFTSTRHLRYVFMVCLEQHWLVELPAIMTTDCIHTVSMVTTSHP